MGFCPIFTGASYWEEITFGTSLHSDERVFKIKVSCPDGMNLVIIFEGYYSVNINLNGWYSGKDTIVEANEEVVKVVNYNKEYEIKKYTFITCSGRFEVIGNEFTKLSY